MLFGAMSLWEYGVIDGVFQDSLRTMTSVHTEKGDPMVTREEVFDVLMEIQKHLIRCKDCKWCEKSGGILWCNIWHNDTNGLNFCSYAERRADDNTIKADK